jgi:hypothetical protein
VPPSPGFFVSVADKGLTLAATGLTADPSELTASSSQLTVCGERRLKSSNFRSWPGAAVIHGRMTVHGPLALLAPSPRFSVSVADKGVSVGVHGFALNGAVGVEGWVGSNAECTEFTEDERRGWIPPTRGCPRVMKYMVERTGTVSVSACARSSGEEREKVEDEDRDNAPTGSG